MQDGGPCYSIGWACIYTHPQAEHWADSNLRLIGYETCLPMAQVKRRDNAIRSLWHTVETPLFPRYLFLRFNHRVESWSPIRATPGVADILRNGDDVAYTPDAVIDALRAIKPLVAAKPQLQPGNACSITQGPLAGIPGVVLEVKRETARLALLILGAARIVHAPLASLAPRDQGPP